MWKYVLCGTIACSTLFSCEEYCGNDDEHYIYHAGTDVPAGHEPHETIIDEEYSRTEDGDIEYTQSARSILELGQLMTGKERKEVFEKAEECIREAYDYLREVERLQSEIYDIEAKKVFELIVCDALAYCYGGAPVMAFTTCGCIIVEIAHCAYSKYPQFVKAKKLLKKAEEKFHEAILLQEILWLDDNAEDWM